MKYEEYIIAIAPFEDFKVEQIIVVMISLKVNLWKLMIKVYVK